MKSKDFIDGLNILTTALREAIKRKDFLEQMKKQEEMQQLRNQYLMEKAMNDYAYKQESAAIRQKQNELREKEIEKKYNMANKKLEIQKESKNKSNITNNNKQLDYWKDYIDTILKEKSNYDKKYYLNPDEKQKYDQLNDELNKARQKYWEILNNTNNNNYNNATNNNSNTTKKETYKTKDNKSYYDKAKNALINAGLGNKYTNRILEHLKNKDERSFSGDLYYLKEAGMDNKLIQELNQIWSDLYGE